MNAEEYNIDKISQEAVAIAKQQYQIELDYSLDSIQQVESILGRLSERYEAEGSLDQLDHWALVFDAYIVMCLEKSDIQGKILDVVTPEATVEFSYMIEERWQLNVYQWCYNRIVYGDGDNVWAKYDYVRMLMLKS